jgi:transcription-repair coupling factor (superfamily II helicase)
MNPFEPAGLARTLADGGRLRVLGLRGSAPAFVVASTLPHLRVPVLWVAPDDDAAAHVRRELRTFGASDAARRIQHYPAPDVEPYSGLSPHAELSRRRVEILSRLQDGHPDVIVASVPALLRRVVPRRVLGNAQELLAVGEEIDRDDLVHSLVEWGYLSTDLTEDPGCFSVRGHVLDLYPPGFDGPLRVELWGDEIESIRRVDAATQRSLDRLDEVVVLPMREEILSAAARDRFGGQLKDVSDERGLSPRPRRRLEDELERGRYFAGIEEYLPLFYGSLDTVFDYLGRDAVVVIGDAEAVVAAAENEPARVLRAYAEGDAPDELVPEPERLYLSEDAFHRALGGRGTLVVPQLDTDGDADSALRLPSSDHLSLRSEILAAREREGGMLEPLTERLERWRGDDLDVVLACNSRVQADRIGEMFAEREIGWTVADVPLTADNLLAPDSPLRGRNAVVVVPAPLQRGFVFPSASLAVLTQAEIFGQRHKRKRVTRRDRLGHALTSFSELKEGDHVVHAQHGIAVYRGMEGIDTPKSVAQKKQEFRLRAHDPSYRVGDADIGELEGKGHRNDFLLLEYRGGDRLYVPIHKLDLLHRYAAVEGATPPLDRLGGQTWTRRRKKVEEAVQKLAAQLLDLYATRESTPGIAFDPPDSLYREFAASFPFEETPDQLEAIQAIAGDLQAKKPMDRLVCGDVGYGKTEVALRAVFQAVASGLQAAILVPTTILALQHYLTFTERLGSFPVSVEMLSRFRTAREKRQTLARLASGELDVVIGTHALLGKDVRFDRLGLLVVDEEHRFGVKQKEKIQQLRRGVDVLAMTATPIPRTLNMALSGIRSFSLIDTPPEGRQEVRTYIARFGATKIREAIEFELRRGGQVFFVHNRVQSIHAMERFLHKLLPGVTIGVAHGQMDKTKLEKVMVDFVRRRYQVLLCTTIIESGIDIPSCNTILIHRADRLGLAQLYQLRGRVGRSRDRGYAWLLVPPGRSMSRDAVLRLKALQDNTSLGSGFKIASRDLEIRGAGNLLGKEQSGSVNAVGLHTYLELLEQAVKTLRGEETGAPQPEIEIRTEAFIPGDYIDDQRDRLLYYKRLSGALDDEEATSIVEELEDLYGRAPEPVQRLLALIRLKVMARRLWVTRIDPAAGGVKVAFDPGTPVDPAVLTGLVARAGDRLSLSADGVMTIRMSREQRRRPLELLQRILRRLV